MSGSDSDDGGGGFQGIEPDDIEISTKQLPDWVKDLRGLATRPTPWIVAALTAISIDKAEERLDEGESAVELIVEEYILGEIILPIARTVLDAGVAIIDGTIVVIFGTDRQVGISEGSSVGLTDLPFLVVDPFVSAVGGISGGLSGAVRGFNQGIVGSVSQLGIAAPIVTTFLSVTELAVFALLIYSITVSVDIPIIRAIPGLKAVTRPLRNIIRRFL